jgi:hypothetical protein
LEGSVLKKQISFIGVVLFLVAGCSSSGVDKTSEAKNSHSPTHTQTPAEEFDPIEAMMRGKPKLAQNNLDEEFLTIAFNSCKKALDDGFVTKDAGSTSYFISSPDSIFDRFKIKEVSVTDGVVGGPIYFNYYPALFDPCDTLVNADFVKPSDDNYVILEHSLEKTTDGAYKWGQHHGGANLNVTTYTVGSDGLISGYETEFWSSQVSYGPLTETELGYFK